MSDNSLYLLYRLHLVDTELLHLKKRAASLDGGKALVQEIRDLKQANLEILERPAKLKAALKELEDKVTASTEKKKTLDKTLYGGSVVNSKEAASIELEIASLGQKISDYELQMLEIIDQEPAALAEARPIANQINQMVKTLESKKTGDAQLLEEIKAKFAAKQVERTSAAKEVERGLLDKYEAIRAKYHGIGMGVVENDKCTACGTSLACRIIEAVNTDKLMTCETCHRILFKVVPSE